MRWKADLTLLFVAAIWGTGFVAQRLATTQLGTLYFNGGRFLLAALAVFVLSRFQKNGMKRESRGAESGQTPGNSSRRLPQRWAWMMLAGVLLFSAAGLQQAGLVTTTIGNASFINGLYVVLVPLILSVFLRQRVGWLSWVAVGVAAVGTMLLSLQGELHLAPGDLIELIGAGLWALHIILVGRLAGEGVEALTLSTIQMTVCGALNLALAFILDPSGVNNLASAWPVIVYSGLFPIGMGFTLQIAGQKHAPTVDATIILSMEAVFATLFGFLFLKELLTMQQLAGCALIFAAMLLAQVRGNPLPVVGGGLEESEE